MQNEVLKGYTREAQSLITPFEAISSEELLSPVSAYFPRDAAQIIDIGAGTGRDAAWLATKGHNILAVEPVEPFRLAGQERHHSPQITWLNDTFPSLNKVINKKNKFDVVLINGVWHHLGIGERELAFPAIREITTPKGLVIMSIRHGPSAKSRPALQTHIPDLLKTAGSLNYQLIHEQKTDSLQQGNRLAGVTWTWLVFRAP